MKKKKLSFIIGILCTIVCANSCSDHYWDGEWSAMEGTFTVILDSSTMEADVTIMLGDTPVNYTTEWDYIDNNSIVYADYGSTQYTVLKKDGEAYTYHPQTGEMIKKGIKFKKK